MEPKDWIAQVLQAEPEESPPKSSQDGSLIESASQESPYGEHYDARDKLYTEMLQHYLVVHDSKFRWNTWYKLAFFIVTMLAFAVMIAAPMISLIIIAHRGNASMSDVALVASGVVGIISAIIVLPKIIAEHLFPKDENKHMIGMVQSMQKNDAQIRTASARKSKTKDTPKYDCNLSNSERSRKSKKK